MYGAIAKYDYFFFSLSFTTSDNLIWRSRIEDKVFYTWNRKFDLLINTNNLREK